MKPIRMNVHVTSCTQCAWRRQGEDWGAWRTHTASEHPDYARFLAGALAALGDTGTYDTSYEEAVLRIAGKVWAAWSDDEPAPELDGPQGVDGAS